jgi:HPt (histidine-containing phosphotransfer) domain-containing protein
MGPGILNAETLNTLLGYVESDQPDFLRDILTSYLADTETRLLEMREARRTGDAARLARTAHTIEGSSLNVGADTLASLVKSVQREAKLGTLPQEDRLRACEEEFARVRQALSGFLA